MNFLNLASFVVLDVAENENDYCVTVETASPPSRCPHCGAVLVNNLPTRFGQKAQIFMDLPMHAKRVGVKVLRQRYRCNHCRTTFLEVLPDIDDKRMATKRLVTYIEKQSLCRTFASLARDIGIDEKTVRNIFRDYVNRLEKTIRFETPDWLGIDEIHIIKPRCVITNIKEHTVINLLRTRDKETLIRYLMSLPKRDQIRYVCMDMWEPYRQAVKSVLPQATIVIDKFHVTRIANQCLETVRKSLRKSLTPKSRKALMHDRFILLKRRKDLNPKVMILESWILNYSDLGKAYELKESFYTIWDGYSLDGARAAYDQWQKQIPPQLNIEFTPLLTAMNNWQKEIFAYFQHPMRITNAYTESLNNLIRVMNRVGRGYSFEALRARILFTEGVHKKQRPKYSRRSFLDSGREIYNFILADAMVDYGIHLHNCNYGSDISTLTQFLEDAGFPPGSTR